MSSNSMSIKRKPIMSRERFFSNDKSHLARLASYSAMKMVKEENDDEVPSPTIV